MLHMIHIIFVKELIMVGLAHSVVIRQLSICQLTFITQIFNNYFSFLFQVSESLHCLSEKETILTGDSIKVALSSMNKKFIILVVTDPISILFTEANSEMFSIKGGIYPRLSYRLMNASIIIFVSHIVGAEPCILHIVNVYFCIFIDIIRTWLLLHM